MNISDQPIIDINSKNLVQINNNSELINESTILEHIEMMQSRTVV